MPPSLESRSDRPIAWRPALLSVVLVLAAAGCGGGPGGTPHAAAPAPASADGAVGAAKPAGGEAPSVNVYSWNDYIDAKTIPDFEAASGIRVRYDLFDSNEVLEGKLLAGNSGYDVVVPSGSYFGEQIQAGLYQPLDRSKLPNWSNLDPALLARIEAYDPGLRHGVPYLWGVSGLVYDAAKIAERLPDAPVDSWRLMFDPEVVSHFADCGVAMLDAPEDVTVSALIHLGLDPNSQDPADLERVRELIAKIRPFVRYFHSSSYIDDLVNGELCLVLGWSGDIYQAIRDAGAEDRLKFFVPKEGALVWFDMMAIPADAPHPEQAHAWINNILAPQVAANITNEVWYANPNLASRGLVEPAIANNPVIFPPADVLDRLVASKPKSPEFKRERTRMWTLAKAGRE